MMEKKMSVMLDRQNSKSDENVKKPLISVILPFYNEETRIGKCISSVVEQSYQNLEIVLIDDGSTDESNKVCEEFCAKDNRCRLYHKTNGGISDARNLGVKEASGEWVIFVDTDDIVDGDYVEYLYDLAAMTGLQMSICQHRVIYENGHIKDYGAMKSMEMLTSRTCIERMLYRNIIDTSAWGKLYAKELFDGIAYPSGRLFEDIAITYKLMLRCGNIAVGYESKYNYIMRSTSITNCTFNERKLDLLEMTDGMGQDVQRHYPELSQAVLARRVYARISTINQMLYTSQYEEKRTEMMHFVRKYRRAIVKDRKTLKIDKIAVTLLSVNYRLYRFIWLHYQKYVRGK